jgi:diguanylate cyclase (GGDEF)-like protein
MAGGTETTGESFLRQDAHNQPDGGLLSGVSDMLHAAAYSAIQKPVDGIAQIINHTTPLRIGAPDIFSAPDHENGWTWVGSMAGNVADFYLLSKGVGFARCQALGMANSVPILEAGATGAMYELAMPVNDKDFAGNKMRNAAIGFGTFATMDGATLGARNLPLFRNSSGFLTDVGIGGAAGMAGGFTHGVMSAELYGKPLNFYDVGKDMASYGAFGVMFGGLDHGVKAGREATTAYFTNKVNNGEPLISIGPIEIHPRGHADWARTMATIDPLTQLTNKAGSAEALKREVARASRADEPLSLINIDLDNFKAVNDAHGHAAGDQVLSAWGQFFKEHFRTTDYPSRTGGDEFEVLTPNTPGTEASRLASIIEHTRIASSEKPVEPEQLLANYPSELVKINSLARTARIEPGTTMKELAERLINGRMPLTGERLTPETVSAEVDRLTERTGITTADFPRYDGNLTVYTDADMSMLAERAGFRFVPQIAQLIKIRGIASEAQIQEAFRTQQQAPADQRPLIGDIMVDKGYATRQQMDEAFDHQFQLRDQARRFRESFEFSPRLDADFSGQTAIPEDLTTPIAIARYRQGLPDVLRPQVEPNGVRRLQMFEIPANTEVVVGASTGFAQLQPGETAASFRERADQEMFDKKELRKQMGLRHDRYAGLNYISPS